MPLTKTDTHNEIRGRIAPNAGQHADCRETINQFVFADLSRGAGTLHRSGAARLDLQGRTAADDVNLQVQIRDVSFAAALVADTVLQTEDPMNQQGAANGVISVLHQSLDSGTIWTLTGTLP
jgi:hypothetical protein